MADKAHRKIALTALIIILILGCFSVAVGAESMSVNIPCRMNKILR